MAEKNYLRHLIAIGIAIAVCGGLTAFYGGVQIANAANPLDIWNLLGGVAIAIMGGLIAFTGGKVSSIGREATK
ncbi:MAG: hypothetical protein GF329_00355 [Candidatus Lokiarchaeota archaeon]|nr:hypothetical protein [Candidatus Lokiarchaeota archaeon]